MIGEEEIQRVTDVLRSGILAQGKVVEEFEDAFAKYCDVDYAIATSSGTAALHTALAALGVKKNDEVITTDFSFIASASSILMQGAKPVFCDIEKETFNIDPLLIEERITNKTKAILPVHLYGHPTDMDLINEIAADHDLLVLEDACQAHGTLYHNQKVGGLGDVGVFSFYPTKNMTTGEGGIITTNEEKIAKKARLIRNHGQHEKYKHGSLGYNYHMTNISAAIGLAQINHLDEWNRKRRENASFLTQAFDSMNSFQPPIVKPYATHCFHQYTIALKDESKLKREEVIAHLQKQSIGFGVHYPLPLHQQPLFNTADTNMNDFPVATNASEHVLSLPVHPQLSTQDLTSIVSCFNQLEEPAWTLV
jgi:perosamine synthetase